jgi:hypothetical protein
MFDMAAGVDMPVGCGSGGDSGRLYLRRAHLAILRLIKYQYCQDRMRRITQAVQRAHNSQAKPHYAAERDSRGLVLSTASCIIGFPGVGQTHLMHAILYCLGPLIKRTGGRVFVEVDDSRGKGCQHDDLGAKRRVVMLTYDPATGRGAAQRFLTKKSFWEAFFDRSAKSCEDWYLGDGQV